MSLSDINNKGIKVLGVGHFVPELIATNDDFAKIVETNDEWITQRTGIKTRHISNGEPTYYLGAMAAKEAVKNAGIDKNEIDLIIAATVTPDFFTPSTACLIERELGINGKPAFDINAACTGFAYAVDMAKNYLYGNPEINNVLVVAAEELSKFVDYTDRASCILFGDGAGAFVITRAETPYASFLGSDAEGAGKVVSRALKSENVFRTNKEDYDMNMPATKEHYFVQDGKEVYKFATRTLPFAVKNACDKAGISPEDLNAIIPHQANVRIIETAAKNLGLSMDKFVVYIDRYGNTSSASIPTAFADAVNDGRIKRGDKVCIVGFGGGLTYGAVVFEY